MVWHKRYCYISYIKSEIADWRTRAWFLKPFLTIIYDLVKPNSTKKLEQYRGCNICYQVLENGKIHLKGKILDFNINFQA